MIPFDDEHPQSERDHDRGVDRSYLDLWNSIPIVHRRLAEQQQPTERQQQSEAFDVIRVTAVEEVRAAEPSEDVMMQQKEGSGVGNRKDRHSGNNRRGPGMPRSGEHVAQPARENDQNRTAFKRERKGDERDREKQSGE